jgi:PleD family two-component response regulator
LILEVRCRNGKANSTAKNDSDWKWLSQEYELGYRVRKISDVCEPMNASKVTLSKVTILVVEDSEPFRRFVCSILKQGPELQPFEARDGVEALLSAGELQPHLILFDIGVPKLNGMTTTRCTDKERWICASQTMEAGKTDKRASPSAAMR